VARHRSLARGVDLKFSRPGAQVVAQYYQLLRLGTEGYRRVQQHCRDVATRLAAEVAALGPLRLLTDGSELPVFAAALPAEITNYTVFDLSAGLREHGWQVPAYTFPPTAPTWRYCASSSVTG
jgi:glutamate decarboxylase